MSKYCLNHPRVKTYQHNPLCLSIWCKDCYDKMDRIYQKNHLEYLKSWDETPKNVDKRFFNE